MTIFETQLKTQVRIKNALPHIANKHILNEIKAGLNNPQKYISPKFFYDKEGSMLFERITHQKEYYPTRTEKSIIKDIYPNLGIDFKNLNIIELGSGDHSKIQLLLQQIPYEVRSTLKYHPIDISSSAIQKSSEQLSDIFPELKISGIVADFFHHMHQLSFSGYSLYLFFGSTIGNMSPIERWYFLKDLLYLMKPGDHLLLGMDMIKETSILERAYNDKNLITSMFNKNILSVINKYTGGNFNPELFNHNAYYNKPKQRIEMHLIAAKNMCISLPLLNQQINILKGESIHTENSHKFTSTYIKTIARIGNLQIKNIYTDEKKWYSIAHFFK
jgi:L-histidine N-alpha-methyltransferase